MIEEIDPSADTYRRAAPSFAGLPLVAAPPAAACVAGVVIPARDEADSIGRALLALAAQRDADGRPLPPETFEVILVANNCRDDTAAVARRVAEYGERLRLHVVELELPPEVAHVGSARRIGMDEACRRLLGNGLPRGVIATTDADTRVAPTWLAATLHEVERGAEAVGGRLLVDAHERRAMAPTVRDRFLRHVGYWSLVGEVMARVDPRPADPWPCHEQFSGASLAVTARAYRAVGGLPPLMSSEDVALAEALERADIEIRHSPAVRVRTSARLEGRAPAGMADLLAGWARQASNGPYPRVPSAATVVARATARRTLRELWQRARATGAMEVCAVTGLADVAGVPVGWLWRAILDAERFGALAGDVEAQAWWRRAPDLVDMRAAIQDLRCWLEPYRRLAGRAPSSSPSRVSESARDRTRGRAGRTVPRRPVLSATTLEQVQAEGVLPAPLAPPPQVA